MGGFGSGRQNGKVLTSDMYVLDVRQLNRGGYLKPGYFFNWAWSRGGQRLADINIRVEEGRVRLVYKSRSSGGAWEQLDYPVSVTYTACNFGGQRVCWRCPAKGCGRRVAKLYGGRV